jgi:hypothetical protein
MMRAISCMPSLKTRIGAVRFACQNTIKTTEFSLVIWSFSSEQVMMKAIGLHKRLIVQSTNMAERLLGKSRSTKGTSSNMGGYWIM